MREKKNLKESSTKSVRRKYDSDFKKEALKLVDSGRSVPEVAIALGISEQLLYNWRNKYKEQANADSLVLQQELEAIRKRLREVEQERDILKKALNIFSRTS